MPSSSINSTTFPTLSTTDTDYYTFLRQNTYELIDDEYDVNLSTSYIFSSTSCNSDYYQREAGISIFTLETKNNQNDIKIKPKNGMENNMKDDKQLINISSQETPKRKKKQKKQVSLICNNR
uniref:Uncharacterized protein n=1 Tax=Bactrocera latifrons TaxID=174628 RepID=A0A0K8U5J7_BACLA